MRFSERYGYVSPVEVLKRGGMDMECATAICNCFDYLREWLSRFDIDRHSHHDESYTLMDEAVWCFFMNQRRNDFYGNYGSHMIATTDYILSEEKEWYSKYDLIEFVINHLRQSHKQDRNYKAIIDTFVKMLNGTFKRLNYAYRIVEDIVVEITDDEEIKTIECALSQASIVRTHFSEALKHLSARPNPNFRNSIKESISAVEFVCREITGKSTLGAALDKLKNNGLKIPTSLKTGFDKLYEYTNDKNTGIRHALMNDTEAPQYEEAKFMLVACSAFVNYIQEKRGL